MAQNYISRGEVITLTADGSRASGCPYRLHGFNGVSLLTVSSQEAMSFQLEGVFEFVLASVSVGDLIYIKDDGSLTSEDDGCQVVFGRAVAGSDANKKFYCRILQSE